MSIKQTHMYITSGLPYAKTWEVTLPNGRSWWNLDTDFEVLCQIRTGPSESAELVSDLTAHLDVTFVPGTNPDLVTIKLEMSGAETRLVTEDGFYDVVMSDVLQADDRAFRVGLGRVYRDSVITAAKQDV